MRISFIEDIGGKNGSEIISERLPRIKEEYQQDCINVNGENAAHGKGISGRIYRQFKALGVDCITMGNHTFSKDVIKTSIHEMDDLIRPVNLIPTDIGQNYKIFDVNGIKLCVTNIMGEIFMDRISESPFVAMNKILNTTQADVYFVDLHAEATSEKAVFAQYYQDVVNAVCGTHTHIQTADERIVGNCAFITDVGMCGSYDSIIGRDIDEVIDNMVHKEKTKFEVASGPAIFQAVVIDIDENNVTKDIKRIQIRPNN